MFEVGKPPEGKEITTYFWLEKAGDAVKLRITRDGKTMTVLNVSPRGYYLYTGCQEMGFPTNGVGCIISGEGKDG